MVDRLFAYGTLMPGKSNAHQLSGIEGQWQKGWARGRFFPSAWGEAVGFPGIILDENGQRIQGMLFSSGDLPAHWNRLDAFEGEGYIRVITRVTLADGSRVRAHIYELAEKISPDDEAPIIRPARDTDRSAIARLHALSWQIAYAPVLPASFLKSRVFENRLEKWQTWEILPGDLVLVAEARHPETGETGSLLGFIAVWCRAEPFIDNLHVHPGCTARGLGTALMQAAARELVCRGHARAWLWAVKSNTRAIRFYERLGGVCTGHGMVDIAGTPVPNVKIQWPDLCAVFS